MTTKPRVLLDGWCLPTGLVKPLSLNDRMHYMAKARWNRLVRKTTCQSAIAAKVGSHPHVHVRLEYTPRVNRRRDTDSLWASAKPAVDGIVDAGVVADDTPEYVTRHEPLILPAKREFTGSRLWLRVWLGDDS